MLFCNWNVVYIEFTFFETTSMAVWQSVDSETVKTFFKSIRFRNVAPKIRNWQRLVVPGLKFLSVRLMYIQNCKASVESSNLQTLLHQFNRIFQANPSVSNPQLFLIFFASSPTLTLWIFDTKISFGWKKVLSFKSITLSLCLLYYLLNFVFDWNCSLVGLLFPLRRLNHADLFNRSFTQKIPHLHQRLKNCTTCFYFSYPPFFECSPKHFRLLDFVRSGVLFFSLQKACTVTSSTFSCFVSILWIDVANHLCPTRDIGALFGRNTLLFFISLLPLFKRTMK